MAASLMGEKFRVTRYPWELNPQLVILHGVIGFLSLLSLLTLNLFCSSGHMLVTLGSQGYLHVTLKWPPGPPSGESRRS